MLQKINYLRVQLTLMIHLGVGGIFIHGRWWGYLKTLLGRHLYARISYLKY